MSASRAQTAAGPNVGDLPRDHAREALAGLAGRACRIADLDRACIFLRDQLTEVSMTAVAVHGLPEGVVGQSFGIVGGLAGRVLITGKPVIADGRSAFPRGSERTHAAASVPIRWSGRVRGALWAASSDRQREIGGRELDALCEVAELGALTLE